METMRAFWPGWVDSLRKRGMTDLVVWLLDAAGPLNILGAQMLYLGQPFFPSRAVPTIHALAYLLEQETEAEDFTNLLKGMPQ